MMSRLLLLLILCVSLAVFRAVAIVLAVVLLLTVLVAFISRPRETLVFFGTLALSALTVAQPIACIIAVTVVVVATAPRVKLTTFSTVGYHFAFVSNSARTPKL